MWGIFQKHVDWDDEQVETIKSCNTGTTIGMFFFVFFALFILEK